MNIPEMANIIHTIRSDHSSIDPAAMHDHGPSKGPRPRKKPEEGAGNNDERELPDRLRPDEGGDAPKTRPPTNVALDREQDPARPSFKEPGAKDKFLNT